MIIAAILNAFVQENYCEFTSYFIVNQSDYGRKRFKWETSTLRKLCPNYFQMERLQYLFSLLGIKETELVFYRNYYDLYNGLSNGEADLRWQVRLFDQGLTKLLRLELD